jgi:cell division protein FtsI/penicillin-binding protein 2
MKRCRQERVRIGVLWALICLTMCVFAARLIHLHVFCGPTYREIVNRQSSRTIDIPATRGVICDRNGLIVANNIVKPTLYAWPTSNREVNSVADYIDKLYGHSPGTAKKRFNLRPRSFSFIDRHMSDALAHRVEQEAPHGLYLREEAHRTYPYGLVGRQILGFTDIDNHGQSGLELSFDSLLAGRNGIADVYRDGLQNVFRVREQAMLPPQPGQSLVLACDWRLQEIVEQELKRAACEYNAESGVAAFVDCNSGEVLALAHYDPDESLPDKPFKLRAIADQFEPGSVFKPITAAGILDAGLVDFDDSIYCESGRWTIGRRTLRDDKKRDSLSFRQIMELSSNIGLAKLAIELGGEQLYQTTSKFGLGRQTGIELPGESAGSIGRPNRWSEYTTAALSMGHAVAVNSLHLAMAFAAVANGGELLKPRLVIGGLDHNRKLLQERERKVIERIMKPATADTLRAILRGVVEHGTAVPVNSKIVDIAGKTGTAQMIDFERKRYFQHKFTASFAGFFPAEQPQIAGVVVLSNPQPVHYGGHTAGPAFRRIAERYALLNPGRFIGTHRVLAGADHDAPKPVEVPDFVGRPADWAKTEATANGLNLRTTCDSGFVLWQFPPAGGVMFPGDRIVLATSNSNHDGLPMIDLTGLSLRQAAAFLSFAGITFHARGTGHVVKQSLQPGMQIDSRSFCQLELRKM